MTDEEINQAMAKHCGIKLFEESDDQGMPVTVLTEFNTPKYTKDLNDMHQVEQAFLERATLEQFGSWLDNLYCAHGLNPYYWRNSHGSGKTEPTPPVEMAKVAASNARQRAEAFLRTVGKWKE